MKLRKIVSRIKVDDRKLTQYALNINNPKGANKAFMFREHLGFTADNCQYLIEQIELKVLELEAVFQFEDEFGKRYQVDIEIQGCLPHQKEVVRTGWIVEPNTDTARLVSLYVKKRQ